MNLQIIFYVLTNLLKYYAYAFLAPFFVAVYYKENEALLFIALFFCLFLIGRALKLFHLNKTSLFAKEGNFIVSMAWIIVIAIGALPFYLSGHIPSLIDAIFESTSGFTTTGSTILTEIEILPKSILFWRNFTHFLGGLGILVFLMALVPLNEKGQHIVNAEMPGPTSSKVMPRLGDSMRFSVFIYFLLSLLELISLMIAGLSFFDAINVVFSTAGTGGFSIYNDSIAHFNSYTVEMIIAVFMLLFATNFNVYFFLVLKRFKGILNEEVRWFLMIVFSSIVLIMLTNVRFYQYDLVESFRYTFFVVASTISTTGFVTYNYEMWPEFARMIVLLLTFVGACGGSTGGGMKVSRITILFKKMRNDIRKILHPRSINVVTMDGKQVTKEDIERTSTFIILYVAIVLFAALIISIDNISFETCFTAALTCISNVGPGFGMVGPVYNFAFFSPLSKIVLSCAMLIGRLEIFPIILLFAIRNSK